jgi:hypothetical protein
MNYLEWNNAIANHFFNPDMASRPVYLCVHRALLRDLYRGPEPMEDEAVGDFVRAMITGPVGFQSGPNICVQARNAANNWKIWAPANNNGIPAFVGYLALFVLAWEEIVEARRTNAYYPRLNQILRNHGYAGNDVNTTQFQDTTPLWDELERWANKIRHGDCGRFIIQTVGGYDRRHIGRPHAQALLRSEDISIALPRVFAWGGLEPGDDVSDERMTAALLAQGQHAGLSDRSLNLLTNPDGTLGTAVIQIALSQFIYWDGAHQPIEDQQGQRPQRPTATAGWKLFVNGSVRRLDLVVDNMFIPNGMERTIRLSQPYWQGHSQTLAAQGPVFFSVQDLKQMGADPGNCIDVCINEHRIARIPGIPVAAQTPMLFRCPFSRTNDWMQPIDTDNGNEHISATRIAILWPAGTDNAQPLQFGPNDITADQCQCVFVEVPLPGRPAQRLLTQFVNFPALADFQPLRWNGQNLLHVGVRPCLEIVDNNSTVNCPENPTWNLVFGGEVRVRLMNHPGAQPDWRCPTNNAIIQVGQDDNMAAFIRPQAPGTRVKVCCGSAQVNLLFLPPNVLDGQQDGWNWQPAADGSEMARFAQNGLEVGNLNGPNQVHLRLAKPLVQVVWWWEKGICGEAELLCGKKEFNDYGELTPYRLCFWAPENQTVSLCFNGNPILTKPGPEYCSEWLSHLLEPHCDFARGIVEANIDSLRINGIPVANILHVPNRPALTLFGGQPHVFFPAEGFNPQDYTVVCCLESNLVDRAITAIPCAGFQAGDLTIIQGFPDRQNGEGVWFLLVRGGAIGNSLITLLYANLHLKSYLQYHAPDARVPLRTRIGEMADDQGANVRNLLDLLANHTGILACASVFSQAIADRTTFAYPASPEFWGSLFNDHCELFPPPQVAPRRGRRPHDVAVPFAVPSSLETTLGLMLKCGFNWCAEPGWLATAYDKILEMCNRGRQNGRDDLNQREQRALLSICPVIYAQKVIERGFPWDLDPPVRIDDRPDQMQDYFAFLPNMGAGNRLRLRVLDAPVPPNPNEPFRNGVECVGFSHLGVTVALHGQEQQHYSISKDFQVRIGRNWYYFTVTVNDRDRFADYMADSIVEDDVGSIAPADLNDVFDQALRSASCILGEFSEGRLALMFHLVSKKLDDIRREENPQRNRLVIYQAAVLSRLHARLGYDAGLEPEEYPWPTDWPLLNRDVYQKVCHVISQAWEAPSRRKMLMKDLIPVEWFIARFHCIR